MEHLIFPELFSSEVKAFFTGKVPGDDLERIAEVASVDTRKIYLPVQRHTGTVHVVDADLEPAIADAVITRNRGILIGVRTADCVPILIHDRTTHVIGAVHAGWRGTAAAILKNTLRTMKDRFLSSPLNIVIAIGPAVRSSCYDVGYEVVESVQKATGEGDYVTVVGEKCFIDLQTANRYQALSMGVPEEHLWISEDCTSCLPDRYFSYRFSKGSTGKQGAFIKLV
ncbi:MAG TPA: peptidoglycan editing factor PgeF [Thermodesulfovibrionales bacterium]|nr:peptidoglycan editing factor PgeF [Thermodesulfovibrionales bacterium]